MTDVFNINDFISMLPQAIMISGGLLVLILQLILPAGRKASAYAVTVFTLVAAASITITGLQAGIIGESEAFIGIFGDHSLSMTTFNGHLLWDSYTGIYTVSIIVTILMIVIWGNRLLTDLNLNLVEMYQLILFSGAGLIFFFSAQDLITLFVGIELASLPLYVMAGWDRQNKSSNEAGLKYFLLGVFSTAFLLLGIALLYGASGATNLYDIYSYLSQNESRFGPMATAGWVLLLSGIGFKVALFPFHGWVADVYEGSVTIMTAFMAALVKISSVAAFFRVAQYMTPGIRTWLEPALIAAAAGSMIYGNIAALSQTNLKRIFAYSSIAHAGYMASLFVIPAGHPEWYLLSAEASAALFFYVAGYAVTTLLVFGTIAFLETESDQPKIINLDSIKGLSRRNPLAAFVLSLGALSFAGIPPLLGFFGKFYILKYLVSSENWFLAIMVTVNSLISVYYYARVLFYAYWEFDEESETGSASAVYRGIPSKVIGYALTVIVLIAGFFSTQVITFAESASRLIK